MTGAGARPPARAYLSLVSGGRPAGSSSRSRAQGGRYPTCAPRLVPGGCLTDHGIDRRRFIRAAGGSLLLGSALAGCDDPAGRARTLFRDRFGDPARWDEGWINVRYEGTWARAGDVASIEVGPAPSRAADPSLPQMEYLGQPVVVAGAAADRVAVEARVRLEGPVEAGLVACWAYDEAYALLLGAGELLLCRYSATDRDVLAARPLPRRPGWVRLALEVGGGRAAGSARGRAASVSVRAPDPEPLGPGLVGIVVNPLSGGEGGRGRFRAFAATSAAVSRPPPRFAYRFAGAVVPDGSAYRARLAARALVPAPVSFEVASDPSFADARATAPVDPQGRLGSVRAWARDLPAGAEVHWRPVAHSGGERHPGPAARLRTPPRPGDPVTFAFGSCTTGRMRAYRSFERAASFAPAFYLHAGDWGYANMTAYDHRADHFHARWTRLLRAPGMAPLLASTPLLLWQDDHDYQADNGWAETCAAYAVEAFDELHANPSDDFFDVRWGDVHVWCLDCRLHASDPRAPDGAGKTRLGRAQKRWLLEGIARSDAPVRVVASAMALRDKVADDPGWHNAYTTERDELLAAFAALDATVVVLSGDSHGQRLIHHHEFGDLYEITSSGTDFPAGRGFGQGRNDPGHTLLYSARTGFAVVDVGPAGPDRSVRVRCIATDDGSVLFEKRLPVAARRS